MKLYKNTGSNGLKENSCQESLQNLALAERLRAEAEEVSAERKGYSAILIDEAKKFADALEKEDFQEIFRLERTDQQYDATVRTPENGKPKEYMGLLSFLAQRFEEFSNPENVRKHFKTTMEKLNTPSSIRDTAFTTPINSMCGYINSMMSSLLPPAANSLLAIRVRCLSAAKEEHQAHIDLGLGIAKGKEQSKDLGR